MNEQIDTIIAKKLSGEASEEDLLILEEWLAEDDANKAEYDQVALIWTDTDNLLNTTTFNTGAAWAKVSAEIANKGPVQKRTLAFPAWSKFVVAAAALLLLGVFVVKPVVESRGTEVIVADAGNREVVLPDSSHVTLRKGSKLTWPATFATAARQVSLEGEAFFDVTRNEQRPFVINAQSVSVKVLGTSFDVNCDARTARVTVATGKVQMTRLNNPQEYVVLTRGEYGTLADDKLTERISADDNYMFWKTGVLRFDNKPLRFIAGELASYYQVNLVLDSAGRNSVAGQLINISFINQDIGKALEELCLVAQCKWQKKNEQYIISAK